LLAKLLVTLDSDRGDRTMMMMMMMVVVVLIVHVMRTLLSTFTIPVQLRDFGQMFNTKHGSFLFIPIIFSDFSIDHIK
jgi:hypothetical protein